MQRNLKNIYIIGPTFGFDRIVPTYEYNPITDDTIFNYSDEEIDLVAWMGGVDISTNLYNERKLEVTQHPSKTRDDREVELWHRFKSKPKLGICRGAQLLCVLNGGRLYQDVDGHGWGNHLITDIDNNTLKSSSVHHQMMIIPQNAQLIAWSKPISTYRMNAAGVFDNDQPDPEIAWIPSDRALLIQGHPEFGPLEFEQYSMRLVDKYIWS